MTNPDDDETADDVSMDPSGIVQFGDGMSGPRYIKRCVELDEKVTGRGWRETYR